MRKPPISNENLLLVKLAKTTESNCTFSYAFVTATWGPTHKSNQPKPAWPWYGDITRVKVNPNLLSSHFNDKIPPEGTMLV